METTTDFRKIQEELLKPFDFKYRIQSVKYGKATVVSYIDARQLQDRLDEVVGAENWQVKYEERKGNLFAGIGIKYGNEWVWKFDCGTESNVEKEKGEASDSFKRAGVMWGVGRFLYSLPIITLGTKKHTNKANKETEYPADDKGNILWTAEDLNKYCHSLNGKTMNINQNPQPEQKSSVPMIPLMPSNEVLWNKVKVWALEKGTKQRIEKIKESYIISEADYEKIKSEIEQSSKKSA